MRRVCSSIIRKYFLVSVRRFFDRHKILFKTKYVSKHLLGNSCIHHCIIVNRVFVTLILKVIISVKFLYLQFAIETTVHIRNIT